MPGRVVMEFLSTMEDFLIGTFRVLNTNNGSEAISGRSQLEAARSVDDIFIYHEISKIFDVSGVDAYLEGVKE